MYCVKSPLAIEDSIKKSRFIAIIFPCQTIHEASYHLNRLHLEYPDANHIVFAYRIKTEKGIVIKFHDAGEPCGTAGKPIYQHLEGKNLINLLCVVIRYFGGIKLGPGGLTRAYANSAKKVIAASQLTQYIEYVEVIYSLDYKQLQVFEYQLKKLNGKIIKQEFSDKINLIIKIPESNALKLANLFETINRK